jgi:hypothetical protein
LLRPRGFLTLCSILCVVKLNQRFADLHMIALAHKQAGDSSSDWRRYRNRGLVGFQLDQCLPFADLIALMDQDLNDITAFDSFCEKRQFDFHGSFSAD